MKSKQNPQIRNFILEMVADHPESVTQRACKKFDLSRTAINNYMRRLIDEGLITAEGNTKARRYKLKPLVEEVFSIEISPGLLEDVVWRFRILPKMTGVPDNILNICQYGFTEMLNNVIDHSESPDATIRFQKTVQDISIMIMDSGVGIFAKIQKDFKLDDPRAALLELSKGKLTSNPLAHSGEGIFFTSRMFEKFSILSGNLFYRRTKQDDSEWFIETEDREDFTPGTTVSMHIPLKADWTTASVFEEYAGTEVGFRKTHVPLKLGRYAGEQLVSRSQAKRVLARFENFSEVLLDFQGVNQIGQPFADEIFRVFRIAHPDVNVIAIRANDNIRKMIAYVESSPPPKSPPANVKS